MSGKTTTATHSKVDSLMWPDSKVELLLTGTHEYKIQPNDNCGDVWMKGQTEQRDTWVLKIHIFASSVRTEAGHSERLTSRSSFAKNETR